MNWKKDKIVNRALKVEEITLTKKKGKKRKKGAIIKAVTESLEYKDK